MRLDDFMKFDISVGAYTSAGDVKATNQDSVFYKTGVFGKKAAGLFIVADGCGGMAHGDEISRFVVTYFNRLWHSELNGLIALKEQNDTNVNAFLEKAINDINAGAIEFGKQIGRRVGTTLSLLLIINDRYYIKNVGDSRVYLIRKENIEQLTKDQSLVAEMVRNNELTLDEAKTYGKKNILTMCVGLFNEVKTYTKNGKIKGGDSFLICCDGLYNYIPDEKFRELLIMREQGSAGAPGDTARLLRESIPQGMAADNVSAVVIDVKRRAWM